MTIDATNRGSAQGSRGLTVSCFRVGFESEEGGVGAMVWRLRELCSVEDVPAADVEASRGSPARSISSLTWLAMVLDICSTALARLWSHCAPRATRGRVVAPAASSYLSGAARQKADELSRIAH